MLGPAGGKKSSVNGLREKFFEFRREIGRFIEEFYHGKHKG